MIIVSDFASNTDTNEPVEKTVEQLSEIVDEASESDTDRSDTTVTDAAAVTEEALDESAVELLERAEGTIESLFASFSDGTEAEISENSENLRTIIEEAVELLETIDLTEVPGAIDYENMDEAIDVSDIPDAIAERDVSRAIRYSKLLTLVEFGEVLDAVDVRDFKQNKDEFEAAVEESIEDRDQDGDEDGDWIVFDALTWLAETVVENGDDGIIDSMDPDMEDATELASDGQMKQVAMQSKLRDAVEEFRESIFEAHDRMKELRETASEQVAETNGDIEQPSSRNPSAYSTMPAQRTDRLGTTGVSTVPTNTRYSTASNPPRIYGSRFETRRDDDE